MIIKVILFAVEVHYVCGFGWCSGCTDLDYENLTLASPPPLPSGRGLSSALHSLVEVDRFSKTKKRKKELPYFVSLASHHIHK
jgi:hypothetical protein